MRDETQSDPGRPESRQEDEHRRPGEDNAKRRGADQARDEDDADDKEDDGDGKPPLYKRPLFWIILIVVAVLVIGGGYFYYKYKQKYVSTDDAFVDAHVVRLASEVSGRLTAVADADNRHVDKGALLATIEPQGPQASLEQARAQSLQAEAQIQQALAQVEAARAQRDQAAAQAREPQATAAKAAADLARYQALERIDPAAVAGTQLDQARANARSTAAQAAAAQQAVRDADAQITVAERQVKAARAQKAAAQAQIAQANVTFGHLDIRAPVAGQVVERSVNIGSYVSPGTQLMAIVPDQIWVTANFKETQITNMRKGQPVDIKVDAFPGVTFHGHVDSIQRGAGQAFALLPPQNATGNYVKVVQRVPVRILFDTPDPRKYPLGPGMSVVPTVKVL